MACARRATELEETRNRLRVEQATLKSLARIEGKARAELGMVLPGRDQVRLAREFVPVGTGLTSRAPLTAAGGPVRTRRAHPRPPVGSCRSLARPDRHRPSAGFAGALCSRGRNRKGGGAPLRA